MVAYEEKMGFDSENERKKIEFYSISSDRAGGGGAREPKLGDITISHPRFDCD